MVKNHIPTSKQGRGDVLFEAVFLPVNLELSGDIKCKSVCLSQKAKTESCFDLAAGQIPNQMFLQPKNQAFDMVIPVPQPKAH